MRCALSLRPGASRAGKNVRPIPTRVHAVIDYVFGVVLILAPYLFGFATGGAAQWVSMVVGVAVIVMSLLTDYELSIAKLIPVPIHLGLDIAIGVLLAASPWLFGFSTLVFWPHLILGIIAIVVPLLTQTQ